MKSWYWPVPQPFQAVHDKHQVAVKKVKISGTGVSPVQVRAFACGYRKNYLLRRNLL